MRRLLKTAGKILALIAIAFIGFLVYATIKDFRPEPVSVISRSSHPNVLTIDSAGLDISLLSWNIGYCGLNKEMDFFYSGGKQVYPEKDVVERNVEGVKDFLLKNHGVDFIMLQEVDVDSRRSHHINEKEIFENALGDYHSYYGVNYRVTYVPVPLSKPMGGVESGVVTYSQKVPALSERHSFEGNFAWPKKLFMLDRCFLVNRYKTSRGNDLVLINTHNSAYDKGELKARQMQQLKSFLLSEYSKGNYVIVGGDWNQCPPGFKADFQNDKMDNISRTDIPADYIKGWTWAFDNSSPTNRRNKTAYRRGETPTTVIDFFLLSPNIRKKSVKNIDLGFDFSDHQPVLAEFTLIY
jgi:endonuclease/exonuclease/phosphatase family metal-dependent hydrolase